MAGLLLGEKLNFVTQNKIEKTFNEKDVVEKYIKGEIRIVTEQARYPLDQIKDMIQGKGPGFQINYDLNPDYQRRRRWGDEKKSKLIESIIINIPIPPVFLYEYDYGKYEVMDGKQRLSAISDFYSDKFSLTNLTEWEELNGKCYSELPDKIRKAIDRRYISSIILLKETTSAIETEQKLKSLVFERLNSGGVDISPQEMRNALYQGKMNLLCSKLSRNTDLCNMWDLSTDEDEAINNEMFRRMDDVELVLRFFAFRQDGLDKLSASNYKDIFDQYLKEANDKYNDDLLSQLESRFIDIVRFCFDFLGDSAFCMLKKKSSTGEIYFFNKPGRVIYDPLMLALDDVYDLRVALLSKKDQIKEKLALLYQQEKTLFDGRNTGLNYINRRRAALVKVFTDIIA